MNSFTSLPPEHPLHEALSSARVVIVGSSLTETEGLEKRLQARGWDYRKLTMGMASAEMRERFRELQDYTRWPTLPMVFVDGAFIGGAEALVEHLRKHSPAALSLPRGFAGLGYLGLVPFLVLATGCWIPGWQLLAGPGLVAYGAVILAFMGGLHWGMASLPGNAEPRRSLVAGVLVAILAWVGLVLEPVMAALLLAASLWGLWLAERWLPVSRHSGGYRRLRARLTALASLALVAGALGLVTIDARSPMSGPSGTGHFESAQANSLICKLSYQEKISRGG